MSLVGRYISRTTANPAVIFLPHEDETRGTNQAVNLEESLSSHFALKSVIYQGNQLRSYIRKMGTMTHTKQKMHFCDPINIRGGGWFNACFQQELFFTSLCKHRKMIEKTAPSVQTVFDLNLREKKESITV